MMIAQLKEETKAHHQAIEAVPRMAMLMKPDLDRASYAGLLLRLHAFISVAEAPVTSSEVVPQAAERRKVHLIERDLAFLAEKRILSLPARVHPDLTTPSRIAGCAYVLEGSTLGGRIIARCLKRSLGLTPQQGAAYFWSYGRDRGLRWAQLCEGLESACRRGRIHFPEIVDGAISTYAAMTEWLSGEGNE